MNSEEKKAKSSPVAPVVVLAFILLAGYVATSQYQHWVAAAHFQGAKFYLIDWMFEIEKYVELTGEYPATNEDLQRFGLLANLERSSEHYRSAQILDGGRLRVEFTQGSMDGQFLTFEPASSASGITWRFACEDLDFGRFDKWPWCSPTVWNEFVAGQRARR